MEESKTIIIKGLAIILLTILGLNIYRTETTKKDLATLNEAVSLLQARLDSLQRPAGVPAVSTSTSNKQVSTLASKVSSLETKVKALQSSVDYLTKAPAQTQVQTKPSSSSNTQHQTNTDALGGAPKVGRVSVSAKVRVENRYVEGRTPIPNVTTGPVGTVVVNVTMNQVGSVNAVSINKASTISDEDILELCKEAALRTRFSLNVEAPTRTTGTIIYTFTAR